MKHLIGFACRGRALRLIAVGAVFLAIAGTAVPAFARTFDPELVLSDANMRDYRSMNAGQIQTFLNRRSGPLKRMSFARHNDGAVAPASVIIWEACQAWHINPRVMLALLQKEQSLLTRRSLKAHTLQRAIGAGCPDRVTNKYPGFGNQMWNGARLLDGYGETSKTTEYVPHPWKPGMSNRFTGHVTPKNLATYKLYVYNPSIGAKRPYGDLSRQSCSGNANFWKIYWKYFGNPLGKPKTTALPAGVARARIDLSTQYARRLYSSPTTLTGYLVSEDASVAVSGRSVHLETVSGNGWAAIPNTAQAVGADGGFAFRLTSQRLQRVRVVYSGGGLLSSAATGLFVAEAVPVVSKPGIVYSAGAFVATGSVAPAVAVRVRVEFQHKDHGRWRSYRTVSATTKNGAWRLRIKLPRGSWRVRASVKDTRFALARSAWAYL
jgi:hypothetical protein